MLGVDRLDMVKGIPQKLLAFEKFLEEHPEWRDKVCCACSLYLCKHSAFPVLLLHVWFPRVQKPFLIPDAFTTILYRCC